MFLVSVFFDMGNHRNNHLRVSGVNRVSTVTSGHARYS